MAVTAASSDAVGPGDAITDVLLQITQQAERLAALGEREAGHYRELTTRLAELAHQAEAISKTVHAMQAIAGRQAAILATLDGLDREVAPSLPGSRASPAAAQVITGSRAAVPVHRLGRREARRWLLRRHHSPPVTRHEPRPPRSRGQP